MRTNFVGLLSLSGHSATSQSGSRSASAMSSSWVVLTRTKQKSGAQFATGAVAQTCRGDRNAFSGPPRSLQATDSRLALTSIGLSSRTTPSVGSTPTAKSKPSLRTALRKSVLSP